MFLIFITVIRNQKENCIYLANWWGWAYFIIMWLYRETWKFKALIFKSLSNFFELTYFPRMVFLKEKKTSV